VRTRGKGGRWVAVYQLAGIPGAYTREGVRFSSLSRARSYARARNGEVWHFHRHQWREKPTGWQLAAQMAMAALRPYGIFGAFNDLIQREAVALIGGAP
jgi:hypothetical protein